MKKMIASLLVACTLMNGAAFAQEPQVPTAPACVEGIEIGIPQCPEKDTRTSRPASQTLGWLGLATMVAGGAMMVPWTVGETWDINNQNYCYREGTRSITFTRGTCGVITVTPTMIKTGVGLIGAGAVMSIMGWRRVTVTPQIDKTTVGASATVKW